EEELKQQRWMVDYPTAEGTREKRRLRDLLGANARQHFPQWFSEEDLGVFRTTVAVIGDWWAGSEKKPGALTHNDSNPRNIASRRDADGLRLCADDWELATLHLPQHDLAELLGFTLFAPVDPAMVEHYLELHRRELERHSDRQIDPEEWRYG